LAEISVVLGYFGGGRLLRGCLDSLLATTGEDVEIIVVVNSPGPPDIDAAGWPQRVHFLWFDAAIGNARALNEGVASTDARWIVLADHDLIFTPGWLDALRSALRDTGADVAASMLLDPLSGAVSEFGIGYTAFNGAHPYKDRSPDHPIVNRRHFPQAACSGGMLLRRDTFRGLGGFDETLATMYGDVDFCLRLKRAGARLVAEPASRIYHHGGWGIARDRSYKNELLKGDHKGAFVWRNRDVLEVDLDLYFTRSFNEDAALGNDRHVACMAMNVANSKWYIDRFEGNGGALYEIHGGASGRRDAERENLIELFGYEVMVLRLPIVYFLDRFVAARGNAYWWSHRDPANDLVIDRNANVVTAAAALGEGGRP